MTYKENQNRAFRAATTTAWRKPMAVVAAGAATAMVAAALISLHAPVKQPKKKIRAMQDRVTQMVLDMTEGYLRFAPWMAAPGPAELHHVLGEWSSGSTRALEQLAPLRFGLAPDADVTELEQAAIPPALSTAKPEIAVAPGEMTGPETEDPQVSRTVAIGRGDTLMKVLTSAGVDRTESFEAVAALTRIFDVKKLQLGQEITLTFSKDDDALRLQSVALAPSVERSVAVERQDNGAFKANETVVPLDVQSARAGAVIEDSLFNAASRAGIPHAITAEMIRVFSYDVDFQREVQRGDSFEVLFERMHDETGRAVKEGRILFASMTLSGQVLRYFRYQPSDEKDADFFTEKGHSVRKALLRTPIDGARLTSGFGMRMHPILGYTTQHKGIDFGAAIGTPIQAAGDGTVEFAGWNGAYGKYVRIKHSGTYSTAYAHMSSFGRDLRQGQRVRQGEVIGYVGTTGRSTGPHLHYEVLVNNQHINPLSVRMPTGRKLEGKELDRFNRHINQTMVDLRQLPLQSRLAQN